MQSTRGRTHILLGSYGRDASAALGDSVGEGGGMKREIISQAFQSKAGIIIEAKLYGAMGYGETAGNNALWRSS